MAITNFPNGLSSFGMPLVGGGIPPISHGAGVFWVDSSVGINAPGRGTPDRPFASIAGAFASCVADRGDLIMVDVGHTETVTSATACVLNKAGVTVVGIGTGTKRPKVTYTATAATVSITAANVTLTNIVFDMVVGAVDSVASAVTITGPNANLTNCKWLMADGTNQGIAGVVAAAGSSGLRIVQPDVDAMGSAGATHFFNASAAINDVAFVGGRVRGNFSSACLAAGSNVTDLSIDAMQLWQTNGTAKAIWNFTAGSTGLVSNCSVRGTTWATAADAVATSTGLKFFNNFGFDDASGATSGVLVPAAGTLA